MADVTAKNTWQEISKKIAYGWAGIEFVCATICLLLHIPYTTLLIASSIITIIFILAELYIETHIGRTWAFVAWGLALLIVLCADYAIFFM